MLSSTANATLVLQWAFGAFLVLVAPFVDLRRLRQLREFTSRADRVAFWRRYLVWMWVTTLVAFLLAPPRDLFVVMPPDSTLPGPLSSDLVRTGLLIISVLVATTNVWLTPLSWVIKDLKKKIDNAVSAFRFFLPVSSGERTLYLAAALSAGFCEEVLYRGFLFQLLADRLGAITHVGIGVAWLVSSAAFGAAHVYQGVKRAAGTAVAGLLLGLMAILTGNLALSIVIHALADAAALWIYRPQRDDPDEAARLIAGVHLNMNNPG